MIQGSESYIAVDTEFTRKRGVYYPIPCLLQTSSDGKDAKIYDPLKDDTDLSELVKTLQNNKVTKVFHALQQDLDVLYKLFKAIPKNVFDVQIAAMFLGTYEMPSYDTLVRDFLQKEIDKSLQYSDWESRPLSQEKLDYATQDVTYLYQLFPKITEKLGYIKRAWVDDEMSSIIRSHNNDEKFVAEKVESVLMESLFKRKDIVNEKFVQCTVYVVRWLYEYSMSNNLMPASVLDLEGIQEVAHRLATKSEIKLKDKKIENSLIEYIAKSLVVDEAYAAGLIKDCMKKKTIILQKPKTFVNARKILLACSQEIQVHQLMVAKKGDIINALVRKNLTKKLKNGWRYEVFGRHLEKLL